MCCACTREIRAGVFQISRRDAIPAIGVDQQFETRVGWRINEGGDRNARRRRDTTDKGEENKEKNPEPT